MAAVKRSITLPPYETERKCVGAIHAHTHTHLNVATSDTTFLFRPRQLLGLPDLEDDSFEHYHADMEGEPGPDHQQMGVSQQ